MTILQQVLGANALSCSRGNTLETFSSRADKKTKRKFLASDFTALPALIGCPESLLRDEKNDRGEAPDSDKEGKTQDQLLIEQWRKEKGITAIRERLEGIAQKIDVDEKKKEAGKISTVDIASAVNSYFASPDLKKINKDSLYRGRMETVSSSDEDDSETPNRLSQSRSSTNRGRPIKIITGRSSMQRGSVCAARASLTEDTPLILPKGRTTATSPKRTSISLKEYEATQQNFFDIASAKLVAAKMITKNEKDLDKMKFQKPTGSIALMKVKKKNKKKEINRIINNR